MYDLLNIIKHTIIQKTKSFQFISSSLFMLVITIIILSAFVIIQINPGEESKENIYMSFNDIELKSYLEDNNFNVNIILSKEKYNYEDYLYSKNANYFITKTEENIVIYKKSGLSDEIAGIVNLYIVSQENNLDINSHNLVTVNDIEYSPIKLSETIPIYFLTFIIFFVLTLYSSHLSYDIAQERSSGLMEMIITTTKAFNHLFGKILAILILSFIQILLLILLILVGLYLSSHFNSEYSKWLNYPLADYLYLGFMVIVTLIGYLALSALGGSLINDLKNVSMVNNLILGISFFGFISATIFIFSPESLTSQVFSYMPLLNIYHIPVRILLSGASAFEYITIFIVNIVYSYLLLYMAAKHYKYSSIINIDDLTEFFKKIKILRS